MEPGHPWLHESLSQKPSQQTNAVPFTYFCLKVSSDRVRDPPPASCIFFHPPILGLSCCPHYPRPNLGKPWEGLWKIQVRSRLGGLLRPGVLGLLGMWGYSFWTNQEGPTVENGRGGIPSSQQLKPVRSMGAGCVLYRAGTGPRRGR